MTSAPPQKRTPQRILVSDFDGTMTRHDFYQLAVSRLVPADLPDYWTEYLQKRLTHFQALQAIFAAIRGEEEHVVQVVRAMEIDPQLRPAVDRLQQAGWRIIVASAGCSWYIQRLLAEAGVSVELHANPGSYEAQNGLRMTLPATSPYFCPSLGVNKAQIVRTALRAGADVAFAGDGYPDLEAAVLVPEQRRFARGALGETLRQRRFGFRSFSSWEEIAAQLVPEIGI
jgi:2,3-diketo-5-methylthio-1-phosphopentane phosphatase